MEKKTLIISLLVLTLLSLASCNLDNDGILWRNKDRTVSDNKDRNYIGNNDSFVYYTTKDGLEKASYSDQGVVISTHDIFSPHYQDLAFLYDENTIIYIDDRHNGQTVWAIALDTEGNVQQDGIKEIEVTGSATTTTLSSYYNDGTNHYLISNNDGAPTVYSVTDLSETTLTLTDCSYSMTGEYVTNVNGLIRTVDSSEANHYYFNGTELTFPDNVYNNKDAGEYTLSFISSGSSYFAVACYDSDFHIYKDDGNGSMTRLTNFDGTNSREFPCYVTDSGVLIFLDYNGSSTASKVYFVDTTLENVTYRSASTTTGVEAEAFFMNGTTLYMLSKGQGLFTINPVAGTVTRV